ncbi:MAG TPA: PadR family transcriptional regulator [Thermoplasmata archaeon]
MFTGKPFGPPPFGFFAKVLVGRGDFKVLVLRILRERPMHGYEITQTLGERSHGFYRPNPGAVYPALRALLRKGYVAKAGGERRKTYRITPAGRRFLRSREAAVQRYFRRFEESIGPERAAMMREMRATGRLLGSNLRDVTPAQAKELGRLFVDLRERILRILAG